MTDQLKKRNADKIVIIEELKSLLKCDDMEASELYYDHVNDISELELAKRNIQYLLEMSVSRDAIKTHALILTIPFGK